MPRRVPHLPGYDHSDAAYVVGGSGVAQGPDMADFVSRLPYEFPEFLSVPFGFTQIPVIAAAAISSSQCAMFGLGSIGTSGSPDGIGQEFFLAGYDVTLCPGDVTGIGSRTAGNAGALAWGNRSGDGYAYLVIGVNLSVPKGQWSISQAPYPGLGDSNSGLLLSDAYAADRIAIPFPAGEYTHTAATAGAQITRESSKSPLCLRVAGTQRLDIAFCIGAAYWPAAGNSGNFYGYAFGQVTLGLTRPRTLFSPAL